MAYETKNYESLLGTAGLSDTLLKNHFTLYDGYVKNTNKVFDLLNQFAREGKTATPEYAELKRRFGWEFNGMRLHELYFSNLKKGGHNPSAKSNFGDKIAQDFGSFDGWTKDFKSTGTMRGIGWTVLTYDYPGNRLFNVWVNEHDAGHLAGTTPLLILDVFEHAYMLDYGLKRADYIEAFFKALDWDEVEKRFSAAVALKEAEVR